MATPILTPAESTPNGFLGFPVPNRPPDFQTHDDASLEAGRTHETVWWPTPDEPGLVVSRHWEDNSRSRGGEYPEVGQLHVLGTLGLGPTLEAVGIQTTEYWSPTNSDIHTLEMTIPWPETFCRDADAAADAGLTHVRFAVSEPNEFFTSEQLVRSLRRGRMLVSGLDPNQSDDWQRERQFFLYWHDLAYHAIGHLGLSKEVAGRMFERAKPRWYWPFGAQQRAEDLTGDVDVNIHLANLVPTLVDADDEDLFSPFRPRRSQRTGSQLIRDHVQSLAAKTA